PPGCTGLQRADDSDIRGHQQHGSDQNRAQPFSFARHWATINTTIVRSRIVANGGKEEKRCLSGPHATCVTNGSATADESAYRGNSAPNHLDFDSRRLPGLLVQTSRSPLAGP